MKLRTIATVLAVFVFVNIFFMGALAESSAESSLGEASQSKDKATAAPVEFSLEEISRSEDEVTVLLKISENSRTSAMTVVLSYDTEKLECIEAKEGEAAGSEGGLYVVHDKKEDGRITLAYVNLDGLTEGGGLIEATFKTKEDIKGKLPLEIIVKELYDYDENEIEYKILSQGSDSNTILPAVIIVSLVLLAVGVVIVIWFLSRKNKQNDNVGPDKDNEDQSSDQ